MRDPKRIDRIIELVRQVWYCVPDWRLGQLILNVARDCGWEDPYFMEDEELENTLKELVKRWKT